MELVRNRREDRDDDCRDENSEQGVEHQVAQP